MNINSLVGQRIRGQREKLGLKQLDIANALQVSPQAVSKWERGENAPDIALLVPLAKLLGISTDNLLGFHAERPDVFEATIFFAVVAGYAQKSQAMPAKAVAAWANGFFFQLTEAVLHHDGIPVKYMGDTLLAFFAGPNHQWRAVQTAFQARDVVSESVTIALNSGEVYLGAIGHPEYSRPDIMGDTVNLAFLTMEWLARQRSSKIGATTSVVAAFEASLVIGPRHQVEFAELEAPVSISELARSKKSE
jgi:class 3 adenylate cyclase